MTAQVLRRGSFKDTGTEHQLVAVADTNGVYGIESQQQPRSVAAITARATSHGFGRGNTGVCF